MQISLNEMINYLKIDEPSTDECTLVSDLTKSATEYAEQYQSKSYATDEMKGTTIQAIKMLASHWYDNRDGNTGSNVRASDDLLYKTVNRLLYFDKAVHI